MFVKYYTRVNGRPSTWMNIFLLTTISLPSQKLMETNYGSFSSKRLGPNCFLLTKESNPGSLKKDCTILPGLVYKP
jgi:hypothetical protein